MKIPDANILIYAHDGDSPFHEKARTWLTEALENRGEPVGIVPTVALAFVRIMCDPRLYQVPLSIADACEVVTSWLDAGAVWVDVERDHFLSIQRLIDAAHGTFNLLTDAHLAAVAIERRATLYSNDRDFLRFQGLKTKNPVQ